MYNRKTENKPNINKVCPDYIKGMARVLDFGDDKYGEKNWTEYTNVNELISALMRHIDCFRKGNRLDEQSGLEHLDHAATNIMIVRWLLFNNKIKMEDLYHFSNTNKTRK